MENRFLTPAAAKQLLRVKQHILEEPNRLMMRDWVRSSSWIYDSLDGLGDGRRVSLNPPCGTAACIAGWICVLNDKKEEAGPFTALTILGLGYADTYGAFDELFYINGWDVDLRERFTTTNLRERASAAAEQIDRFIERHKIAA